MSIQINEGKPTVAVAREFFERTVRNTATLAKHFPLVWDDKRTGYVNPDTDKVWVGFAIGLRFSRRWEQSCFEDGCVLGPALDNLHRAAK